METKKQFQVNPWWIDVSSKVQDTNLKPPGSSIINEFDQKPETSTNNLPAEIVKYDVLSVLVAYLVRCDSSAKIRSIPFRPNRIFDRHLPTIGAKSFCRRFEKRRRTSRWGLVFDAVGWKFAKENRRRFDSDAAENEKWAIFSAIDGWFNQLLPGPNRNEKSTPKSSEKGFFEIEKKLEFDLSLLIWNRAELWSLLCEICLEVPTELFGDKFWALKFD